MTTLDDKILGEKLQYYCSSSEDEDSDKEDEEGQAKTIRNPDVLEPELEYSADGSAINTGNTHTHTFGPHGSSCKYCLCKHAHSPCFFSSWAFHSPCLSTFLYLWLLTPSQSLLMQF